EEHAVVRFRVPHAKLREHFDCALARAHAAQQLGGLERGLDGEADLPAVEVFAFRHGLLDSRKGRSRKSPPYGARQRKDVTEEPADAIAFERHGRLPAPRGAAAAETAAAAAKAPAAESAAEPAAAESPAAVSTEAAGIAADAVGAPAEEGEEERDDRGDDAHDERAREQPGEEPHDAAGGDRAERAAEDGAQDAAHHHGRDEQYREVLEAARRRALAPRRRGKRLALRDADHGAHAGAHAAEEVALPEAGHDDVAHDSLGDRVVERPLEAVAHHDAKRPVVLGDGEERPVVHALAAELPLLCDAKRVLLDRLLARRGHHDHRDLAAL